MISKFIDLAVKGQSPVIFGDGTATRDFVSVHDVVDLVMLMLENDNAVGKVFNCGTGKPTRINELARTVIDLCGAKNLEPGLRPERPGDIKDSYADISLAKKVLGYQPAANLEDGLREIIDGKRRSF